MAIVIDISEAVCTYREEMALVSSRKAIEAEINTVISLAVSEGVEALANLSEEDIDDWANYEPPLIISHEDPNDNLLIEVSDRVLRGLLHHVQNCHIKGSSNCLDTFKVVGDGYVVIDTL